MYGEEWGEGLSRFFSPLVSAISYWARTACWVNWWWAGWHAKPRSLPGALTWVPTRCTWKTRDPGMGFHGVKHTEPKLDPMCSAAYQPSRRCSQVSEVFNINNPNKIKSVVCQVTCNTRFAFRCLNANQQMTGSFEVKSFECHSPNLKEMIWHLFSSNKGAWDAGSKLMNASVLWTPWGLICTDTPAYQTPM